MYPQVFSDVRAEKIRHVFIVSYVIFYQTPAGMHMSLLICTHVQPCLRASVSQVKSLTEATYGVKITVITRG